MGAGKSTVAQALAERLPKSVHLRGDLFRRLIVSGRVEMSPDPVPEAVNQLRLRYDLAWDVAAKYAEAGFTVVYQDVILGEFLGWTVERLQAYRPAVIVLDPSAETLTARDKGRTKNIYGDPVHGSWTAEMMRQVLHDQTPHIGLWIDTSAQSVDETVDAILAGLKGAGTERSAG
ncbi:phosphotransferase [Mesorhizobium sp. CGMCC 1.15528]|uniref:Phosphotransferase n=2 Tax=Mesorhizobium zhangyense TaxID=1776730 RepID=A0A7C9R616_9HYPH|nr:phosphotransferase [Mesorhizobium zhangyense]